MQKKFEDRFSQKVVSREDRGEGVAAGQSTQMSFSLGEEHQETLQFFRLTK